MQSAPPWIVLALRSTLDLTRKWSPVSLRRLTFSSTGLLQKLASQMNILGWSAHATVSFVSPSQFEETMARLRAYFATVPITSITRFMSTFNHSLKPSNPTNSFNSSAPKPLPNQVLRAKAACKEIKSSWIHLLTCLSWNFPAAAC